MRSEMRSSARGRMCVTKIIAEAGRYVPRDECQGGACDAMRAPSCKQLLMSMAATSSLLRKMQRRESEPVRVCRFGVTARPRPSASEGRQGRPLACWSRGARRDFDAIDTSVIVFNFVGVHQKKEPPLIALHCLAASKNLLMLSGITIVVLFSWGAGLVCAPSSRLRGRSLAGLPIPTAAT